LIKSIMYNDMLTPGMENMSRELRAQYGIGLRYTLTEGLTHPK